MLQKVTKLRSSALCDVAGRPRVGAVHGLGCPQAYESMHVFFSADSCKARCLVAWTGWILHRATKLPSFVYYLAAGSLGAWLRERALPSTRLQSYVALLCCDQLASSVPRRMDGLGPPQGYEVMMFYSTASGWCAWPLVECSY